jgi:hypothetical protein
MENLVILKDCRIIKFIYLFLNEKLPLTININRTCTWMDFYRKKWASNTTTTSTWKAEYLVGGLRKHIYGLIGHKGYTKI